MLLSKVYVLLEELLPLWFDKNDMHSTAVRSKGTYLSWADLDVEVAPLIRDLQDLGPGEAVNPQAVAVDQQAIGTNAQHDFNPF